MLVIKSKNKILLLAIIFTLLVISLVSSIVFKENIQEFFQPNITNHTYSSHPQSTTMPTPTTIQIKVVSVPEWKTYTNSQYGFELKYPAIGNIMDDGCFKAGGSCGSHTGECGKAIKENTDRGIYIDNFFSISAFNWNGTIEDYLKKNDPQGIGTFTSVNNKTADEAIQLTGTRKDAKFSGYPPLAYVLYIFRKRTTLYLIMEFQNAGNIGGCIPSVESSLGIFLPAPYGKWDIGNSFTFQ